MDFHSGCNWLSSWTWKYLGFFLIRLEPMEGGAFVLIYLACILMIGVPIMIGEIILEEVQEIVQSMQ